MEYLELAMKDCLNKFNELYQKDEYISKHKLDNFFDRYQDVIELSKNQDFETAKKLQLISQYGYEIIDRKNKKYVEKHLIEDKEYFDTMFKKIDPNILLDDEQRKAILIDEDYSLIIAGAGSGKTTTMAAKVKYLIEKKKVDSNKIILLSFTNKATEELHEILNNQFHLNVEVLTFHKLGMKFIRQIYNTNVKICSEGDIQKILSDYFTQIVFKNKKLLKEYEEVFSEYLFLRSNCLKFDTYDLYYENYMIEKYEECKNNIEDEIKKMIHSRKKYFKTINGDYVASENEYEIANYLYKNGIIYEYEKIYPFKLSNGRTYKPDFTIHGLVDTYLEYYGLASLKKDGTITSIESSYANEISLKRKTHKKNETDLIEIFGEYEDDINYLELLECELKSRNIIFHKKSSKEIFFQLLRTSKENPYYRLIKLLKTFINLFKELGYNESDFEELYNKTKDPIIKRQLRLLKHVFKYYQAKLRQTYQIDFQDMIHYAYQSMEKIKNKMDYDYVIIDEYQDISVQRYSFAKKISNIFHAKIVAVGDDWQTIYSFSGSDIELFTKFYNLMGYAEIIKITNTYRNSQELINIAGRFVSRNGNQIVKQLKSNKHLDYPIEIIPYEYGTDLDNLPEVLDYLINYLYASNPKDRILILGRFNDDLDNLLNSKYFSKRSYKDDKIICNSIKEANIDFLTVHKSKGLGYDQVILINSLDDIKGFPSQIRDEPVIKLLKGNLENVDDFVAYPEERRLFYVAMTRTKNKLYILTPSDFQYRSIFVKEIQNDDEVLLY